MGKTSSSTSVSRSVAAATLLLATAAEAGPPFVTDDPEPVFYGHVEAYVFTEGAVAEGRFGDAGSGLEINYGALRGLQLSGAIGLEYGEGNHLHMGAAEFGAKYRFLEEGDDGWWPQLSVYPQAEFSLGGDEDGATHYLLPLWAQKSVDDWTVFGGGGYRINPGADGLNSWFGGLAVDRTFGRLTLGAEIYGETRDTKAEPGLIGLGLGVIQELDESFELLGSVGPEFRGPRTGIAYYIALGWHR